jgi:hypothetical protein
LVLEGNMKITKGKVRVEPNRAIPPDVKSGAIPKVNVQKPIASNTATAPKVPAQLRNTLKPTLQSARPTTDGFSSYNDNTVAIKRIIASAKEELELIRKMKAETLRYQQQTATKARSEAHQVVLNTRLKSHREIEEIIRQASEEIQKVLADIRVTRITAQEELATQRRYTDAAKLNSITLSFKEAFQKATEKEIDPKSEIVKS